VSDNLKVCGHRIHVQNVPDVAQITHQALMIDGFDARPIFVYPPRVQEVPFVLASYEVVENQRVGVKLPYLIVSCM
jgi:hypothetical protein